MGALYEVRVEVNVEPDDDMTLSDREIAERGWDAVHNLICPIVEIREAPDGEWRQVDLEDCDGS